MQIMNGPFANFLATIDSTDKDQRVWILIDLMGQTTRALVMNKKLKHTE